VRPVEKAWKQQRQFLSDASHELKTPLTVILSNAELLESADLEDRSARWADNIHSEARQMKTLVEEMLTLARADNMAPTVAPVQVSLSDVATDCALAFEPVAFEAGKGLEYEITDETFVFGDPDKLRRLISVLLDNAIKYGSGTVRLQLQKTEKQARLIVSNPGTPIPPEQLEHLFERFYRADISRGEQSGFGLGLSIAKTLAEEHRGTLKAESDSVSTRFIFTLPLKK
jgi:signal transduction histidine kinase